MFYTLVLSLVILATGCIKTGSIEKEDPAPPQAPVAQPRPETVNNSDLHLSYILETLAGYTAGGFGTQDGFGTYASFYDPFGVTTDKDFVYVADGSSVRKVNKTTSEVTTLSGIPDEHGTNVDGDRWVARFDQLGGITISQGKLYVTDSRHTIREVDIETGSVRTIAGLAGSVGSTDGIGSAARFNNPWGITAEGHTLYITDANNHLIRKLDLTTNRVTTIAGALSQGNVDGTGMSARFYYPTDLVSDGEHIYVTDLGNNNIRRIEISTGVVRTIAGSSTGAAGSLDGRGQNARFNAPMGITADKKYLYVADVDNCIIRKIEKATATVETIAGSPGQCQAPVDGPKEGNRLKYPAAIEADMDDLFIVDEIEIRRIR